MAAAFYKYLIDEEEDSITMEFYNDSITMKACKDCKSDCVNYKTPIGTCFNPSVLFPHDPQWADFDTKDIYFDSGDFQRTFYESKNGTCVKPTETFTIPLDTAVGPLGDPRPCGIFTIP